MWYTAKIAYARSKGEYMQIPKELETLRERRVWICYPMIWNETKHNGVGGYDKPPVNPYTLYNGSTDKAESLATFDEAVAQIGKTAKVRVKGYDDIVETPVVGVGIALGGTGICGVDLDNVFTRETGKSTMTREALTLLKLLDTYTEVSPSGNGLHALFFGELPKNVKKIAKPKPDVWNTDKAEYQLFDSGYLTVSGESFGLELAERTAQIAAVYELFFCETEPRTETQSETPPAAEPTEQQVTTPAAKPSSSVVSVSYRRWLDEARRLSDSELLERIYASGRIGARVRELYGGDTGAYSGDHSRADQALCSYLYSFTDDRARTERLFRASALYRSSGKSCEYISRTLNKAEKERVELVGHIEYTKEEKRAYAKRKEAEERAAKKKQTAKRYNFNNRVGGTNERRKI